MKAYLQKFDFFTEEDIEAAFKFAKIKQLAKSEYFIKEGKVCSEVAFIKSGIFRSYYTSEQGVELTYCINFPNNFMTAYSSYITGEKTLETMQAMTPAELLVIPKKEIDKLSEENTNWMRFLKIMAEEQYLELEKRIFQLQKEKAKQRYLNLLENQPEYIQNIPLQYLASYLGITQRHLSRLRKEISFRQLS